MNNSDPFVLKRSKTKVIILTCVFIFGLIFIVSGSAIFVRSKFFNKPTASNLESSEEAIEEVEEESTQPQQATQPAPQPQAEETE